MPDYVYLENSSGPNIVLNNNIEFVERYQSRDVQQAVRKTVGGGSVVFYGPNLSGQPITLRAVQDRGWVTYQTYLDILALSQQPGYGHPDHGSYLRLVYGAETLNVMFRHEEAPAVDMSPLVDTVNLAAGSYMSGSLKFVTI